MREPDDAPGRARAVRARADAAQPTSEAVGVEQGLTVLSYLIAGVLVWGAVGWLADRMLHTGFLLPIGIVAGAGLGIYLVIARFGQLGSLGPARPLKRTGQPRPGHASAQRAGAPQHHSVQPPAHEPKEARWG